MLKTINIFIINLFILTTLDAAEPRLATLNSVTSNELQIFQIRQNTYSCRPYGVVTLNKLHQNSNSDSMCKKSIEQFYIQNPDSQYLALNLLKIKQMYHLEFRENRCILFAKGEKSLSEILLERGVALLRPDFKDEVYGVLYKRAQDKAKFLKRGLWGENITKECIVELYEK